MMNPLPLETIYTSETGFSQEAAKLYVDEGWTLREIAIHLGVSHETVAQRLRRAGVKLRTRGERHAARQTKSHANGIDARLLRELYSEEGLGVGQIGRRLGISRTRVYYALRRQNIPRRPFEPLRSKKYARLYDLKPGESFEVDRPSYQAVYNLARRQKMRVSLRQIDECRYWITRIA